MSKVNGNAFDLDVLQEGLSLGNLQGHGEMQRRDGREQPRRGEGRGAYAAAHTLCVSGCMLLLERKLGRARKSPTSNTENGPGHGVLTFLHAPDRRHDHVPSQVAPDQVTQRRNGGSTKRLNGPRQLQHVGARHQRQARARDVAEHASLVG